MNRIYLVRHGENRANLTKELSSKKVDYPLTEKGTLQAQQTAEYFAGKDIHAIYSSPLKRASQTAEIIARRLCQKVTVMENFREVMVGVLEGPPPIPEKWAIYNEVVSEWENGNPTRRMPGGENYLEAWERMSAGVRQIIAGQDNRNFIIVGHGALFTYTLWDLCPGSHIAAEQMGNIPNCSFTEILVDLQDGRLSGELVAWAYHNHLHGAAAELVRGLPSADTWQRQVRVIAYDPAWPLLYQDEAERLGPAFGAELVALHHIGSTAIPGMSAKPVIDILAAVRDIQKVDALNERLAASGYRPKGEFGIPGRRYFYKGSESIHTHHLHVFQEGDPQISRHLGFRDYLTAHPQPARQYSHLKQVLAEKHALDVESYIAGKDTFIKEIDQKVKAWKGYVYNQ